MGHSCRTLLWDTLVGHTLHTRLPPKVTLRGCKTSVSYETSSKSHAPSLKNERFVRDFLQKSHVKSLQNERFVRDFLQKSHVKVCKTNVSYETSSKSQAETPHRSTHITQPCQAVSRFQLPPNNTRSHANPNVTATFTSTTTHNLPIPCACHESFRVHMSNAHKVLRLPRHVTSVTPRNLTIPCACHKTRTSTPQKPHQVLRLPRKVTISSHVSFNKIFCTTPHVCNDFDPF